MADVNIQLGYKSSSWFSSNPTLVLLEGQIVFKLQTGEYKIGDGTTQLSALSFLGASSSGVASFNSRTGVVTPQSGDYTTAQLTESTNKKFVTDAQLVVIGNTSGTNTGDQNLTPYAKHIRFFSGQWVCQPGSGAYSTLTVLSGIIWFVPFVVDHDTPFTDIGMEIATAAAASNINLALYNDDGTGQAPASKIEESGNLSSATTGLKSYTFSPSARTLLASSKIYWLAFQVSSNSVAVRYNSMISIVIPSTGNKTSLKTLSQAYGTFPASGAAAIFNPSANNFKIMLKPQ